MINESLKQLIVQVRDSLESVDSERQAEGRAPLFELESLELEIKFTVNEGEATKGGFDIKVVSLGTENSVRSEEVQTLRLTYRVASHAAHSHLPGTRFHGDRASTPTGTGTEIIE